MRDRTRKKMLITTDAEARSAGFRERMMLICYFNTEGAISTILVKVHNENSI